VQKIQHSNRERVPGRVVHALGSGAQGSSDVAALAFGARTAPSLSSMPYARTAAEARSVFSPLTAAATTAS
jgi:catalase